MRVLHLFQEYLSISETWAFNLIDHLSDVDNAIGAVYYNRNDQYFPEKFSFLKQKEDLYNLYKNPKADHWLRNLFLRIKRKLRKQELVQISKWISTSKPDVIHVHFGTTAAHFLPLLLHANKPFLVSFYGYDYGKAVQKDPKLSVKYQQIFKAASLILVEEESGISHLVKLGCNPLKIKLQRLGVNINQIDFVPFESYGEPLKFLQIANFVEKKGQADLVKTVVKYKSELENKVEFTFIGDYETAYGKTVKNLIQEHQIERFFKFENAIPYHEIHDKIGNYDAFFHFSKYALDGDCEGGAPTILLDAQAVGIPILSTNHCDIPRYISNYANQFLVSEGNLDEIYHLLSKYINKELDTGRIVKEGRKHVEVNFSINKNAALLVDTYHNVSRI